MLPGCPKAGGPVRVRDLEGRLNSAFLGLEINRFAVGKTKALSGTGLFLCSSQELAAVPGSGPSALAVRVPAAPRAPVQGLTGSSRAVRTHCVGRPRNIAGSFQTA